MVKGVYFIIWNLLDFNNYLIVNLDNFVSGIVFWMMMDGLIYF